MLARLDHVSDNVLGEITEQIALVFEIRVEGRPGDRGFRDEPGDGRGIGAVAGEHIHPGFQESFQVISGRRGTRVDGVERMLTAGEKAVAVPGTWHDFWNAGEEEAHVLVEFWPLYPRFEQMIGTLYGLANAGKTNSKGMPSPLQLALTGREFQDVAQFAKPPRAVQRVMFGLLGPIGRMRGYRGIYPEYCHPHGRTTPDPAVLALAGLAPPDQDDLNGARP